MVINIDRTVTITVMAIEHVDVNSGLLVFVQVLDRELIFVLLP